jgi:hypothetical protein
VKPRPTRLLGRMGPMAAVCAVAALLVASTAKGAEGPAIRLSTPPGPESTDGGLRACSFRHPACVHGAPGTSPATVLGALSAVDHAWETLTGALGLPAPDGDLDGAWHVYLVDGIAEGSRAEPMSRDPRASLDRAASFAFVDRAIPAGCLLDLAVARAVAQGSLWRAAPATDPGSARAETQMLARLATPCAGPDDDVRAFQGEPERTLIDPESPLFDSGASTFFQWLDTTFSAQPAALVVGMWALAPTHTPPGAARWAGKPTGFDVLRSSLAGALGTDSNLDDVFVKFAVDRAVDRGLARPGVRLAWHVPWPEHPRRFASPVAVAPSGASYVMIDHAGAPAGASLRVEAAWEDYGRMQWVVVKLDATGKAQAVLPISSTRLATHAAITVELVDAVDRFLVVGVNVGSTEHPFDPDQGWWEPHGWLLTVQAG